MKETIKKGQTRKFIMPNRTRKSVLTFRGKVQETINKFGGVTRFKKGAVCLDEIVVRDENII